MSLKLKDSEIENCLQENIPSDPESCVELESNVGSEPDDDQPEEFVLHDNDDILHDPDDDLPLSNFVSPTNACATNPEPVYKPPKWKKSYSMKLPDLFSGSCSIPEHIQSLENPTPLQLFRLFWSEDLQEIICFQTNLYAFQTGKQYKPTTRDEIDVFIGLNLVMSIKKLPSYKDYWSSTPDLKDSYISSFMPLSRFSWLLNHLHLNDNTLIPPRSSPDYDKLYKIRPLIEIIQRNFRANYLPSEKIAVDESMIKFKGRTSLKQYIPKKPIKRGYKVWMKCADSGYCLDFDLYTGKQNDKVETDLGGKVVRQLCEDLKGKNHKVYFDNYFNSYQLQIDLLSDNILACGTVNANRKLLPKLKDDKKLKRGQHDYRVSDTNVSMIKWKDKRSVHVLSNFHNPRSVGTVIRRERNGDVTEISCPDIVKDYNANMNFVDKFDQLKSCYAIDRKSKKWWHRIFFHFLDCCVVNAFIIYKDLQKQKDLALERMTIKQFRRSIYQGILGPAYVNRRYSYGSKISSQTPSPRPVYIKRHKPTVPEEIRLESSRHQPEQGTSRRCCRCSTKSKPVRTIWHCNMCKVPLCLRKGKTCFAEFHKK